MNTFSSKGVSSGHIAAGEGLAGDVDVGVDQAGGHHEPFAADRLGCFVGRLQVRRLAHGHDLAAPHRHRAVADDVAGRVHGHHVPALDQSVDPLPLAHVRLLPEVSRLSLGAWKPRRRIGSRWARIRRMASKPASPQPSGGRLGGDAEAVDGAGHHGHAHQHGVGVGLVVGTDEVVGQHHPPPRDAAPRRPARPGAGHRPVPRCGRRGRAPPCRSRRPRSGPCGSRRAGTRSGRPRRARPSCAGPRPITPSRSLTVARPSPQASSIAIDQGAPPAPRSRIRGAASALKRIRKSARVAQRHMVVNVPSTSGT